MKSKFFRVATEGATTDGRKITRKWIEQMAKNFDPKKYGARIWMEHLRGLYPDSTFKAYGDVAAIELREVEDGKLALYAQLKPSPELIEINRKGQKIYTSIEVDPNFADSGEAYLVGLGITDSPASLGTDVLSFAASNPAANPFSSRKTKADNVISEAVEADLQFVAQSDDQDDEEGTSPQPAADGKFADRIRSIVGAMFNKKDAKDGALLAEIQAGIEGMAQAVADNAAETDRSVSALQVGFAQIQSVLAGEIRRFDELMQRLDAEPSHHSQRPPATGDSGEQILTDC